ncbi:DUF4255 domain-containing protein [Vitiosangium sp. GDMCC 1.1324]|nr:DUF4255 domain-containing protein [Vitiosangium sp. GDMCC 1.1324]
MLSEMLVVLKETVSTYLSTVSGSSIADSDQGQVVFLESERVDALDFKLGAISLLLANVEEDHTLRSGEPYRRTLPDGTVLKVQPSIHLNAYVLFVARFKDYTQSLRYISLILQFFLTHRVLDHENTPALSDRIEKLTMELLTLPFSEQNHLWSILGSAYHPSLLYKVRMVVFQDDSGVVVPPVTETSVRSSR